MCALGTMAARPRIVIRKEFETWNNAILFLNRYRVTLKRIANLPPPRPISPRTVSVSAEFNKNRNAIKRNYNNMLAKYKASSEKTNKNLQKLIALKAFLNHTNMRAFNGRITPGNFELYKKQLNGIIKSWGINNVNSVRRFVNSHRQPPSSARSVRGPP